MKVIAVGLFVTTTVVIALSLRVIAVVLLLLLLALLRLRLLATHEVKALLISLLCPILIVEVSDNLV